MQNITREMLKIYKPRSCLDWLNYKLVKKDLTFHHIIKCEHGGKMTKENGALLMPVSHQYLHLIEYKEHEIYESINQILKFVNNQMTEPTLEQRRIIEYLLEDFEDKHLEDKNSKGKPLIKQKYLERW